MIVLGHWKILRPCTVTTVLRAEAITDDFTVLNCHFGPLWLTKNWKNVPITFVTSHCQRCVSEWHLDFGAHCGHFNIPGCYGPVEGGQRKAGPSVACINRGHAETLLALAHTALPSRKWNEFLQKTWNCSIMVIQKVYQSSCSRWEDECVTLMCGRPRLQL